MDIHQLNCATNRRNSGYGGCPVDWKLIKGCLFFDDPVSFSEAQLASLQATLQGMASQDNKTGRCYPIHNFLNPQDNSDDPTFETFSDGAKSFVRDGVNDWTFQITAGGFCLLQAMRTHNGNGTGYVLFYDADKKILGYNNSGQLAAIPLMVFQALPWKLNTGSNVSKYLLRFIFTPNYVNEDSEYTQADFPLTNIVGLKDVRIIPKGFNHATGLTAVEVVTECGGANLFDSFSTDLALIAVWSATNRTTGGSITITSVTPVPSSKMFNIILNTADPDYPTDGGILLQLAAPSVLAANGISGYESEIAQLDVISS